MSPIHVLDSSVARKIITGASYYKEYYDSEFSDQDLNVSDYVFMEFRRSLIIPLLEFICLVDMPENRCLDDALAIWEDHFSSGKLKAVGFIVRKLIRFDKINPSDADSKQLTVLRLSQIVNDLEREWRTVFVQYNGHTECPRAKAKLKLKGASAALDAELFAKSFNAVVKQRKQCDIGKMLFHTSSQDVAKMCAWLKQQHEKSNPGFYKVTRNLTEFANNHAKLSSCIACAKIGDAVIAIDTSKSKRLEHTDLSFEDLCDSIGLPHKLHPSARAVLKTIVTQRSP